MPRITYNQTNFTAGELSPRLYGRVDIARYQNGAKIIENGTPLMHGGILKRAGTRFITEVKESEKLTRLIPYIFNKDQRYVLEFGDQYIRFYKNGAQIMSGMAPYEIATSYNFLQLRDINYVQGADSMFLAHEDVPLQRLQRFADDKWVISAVPFVTEPFAEIGFRPAANLTLSAATVGTGRTLTAGSSTFLQSDVGREITYNGGIALITAYTSGTVVTATITVAFDTAVIAGNEWIITGSPQSVLFSSESGPVGAIVKLDTGKSESLAVAKIIEEATWSGGDITIKITAHGYTNGDVISISACSPAEYYNGKWKIKGVTADTFKYTLGGINVPDANQLGYASKTTQNTPINTFRTSDVGKHIKINRGLVKITEYVSPTLVYGQIRQELDAKVPVEGGAWSMESSVWNNYDRYPRAVSLFEQRLVAGGSPAYPQQFWMSRIGEYLNFELGLNDDDAMSFVISSDQINPVSHMSQIRVLAALTNGGEFTLRGGIEKPITPTNIQIKNQTTVGCNSVKPIRVGNELFFVQRSGKKLMALGYKSGGIDGDDFAANDLTVLSEHITESGIVDMAYQMETESILWCVRNDGKLISLTVNREQEVIAWARHYTDGFFESVASIPGDDGDEIYVVVRREIDGATVRYVERLDLSLYSDSSITGISELGADTWTALDHLEGKTVDILADGAVMPQQAVTSGQITLTRNAYEVKIGLPFKVTVSALTPEIQTGTGSTQGNSMRTSEISLRVKDTIGCKVNGSIVTFRNFGTGVLDQAPVPFTGVKRIENLGWERGESELIIEHEQPLPFHLLSIIRKFQVND